MQSVTSFIRRRLKLKVNEAKSAVALPQERKFLGFSFTGRREPKRLRYELLYIGLAGSKVFAAFLLCELSKVKKQRQPAIDN